MSITVIPEKSIADLVERVYGCETIKFNMDFASDGVATYGSDIGLTLKIIYDKLSIKEIKLHTLFSCKSTKIFNSPLISKDDGLAFRLNVITNAVNFMLASSLYDLDYYLCNDLLDRDSCKYPFYIALMHVSMGMMDDECRDFYYNTFTLSDESKIEIMIRLSHKGYIDKVKLDNKRIFPEKNKPIPSPEKMLRNFLDRKLPAEFYITSAL